MLIDIASVAVPGLIQRNAFNPKVAAFMQASMRHKLVFHAVIAFAQGYREVANTGATEPSSAVLYHRWKATQGLHERLRNPETQADDISILTTFLLTDNVVSLATDTAPPDGVDSLLVALRGRSHW